MDSLSIERESSNLGSKAQPIPDIEIDIERTLADFAGDISGIQPGGEDESLLSFGELGLLEDPVRRRMFGAGDAVEPDPDIEAEAVKKQAEEETAVAAAKAEEEEAAKKQAEERVVPRDLEKIKLLTIPSDDKSFFLSLDENTFSSTVEEDTILF